MFNKLLVVNQEIEMMFRDDYKSKGRICRFHSPKCRNCSRHFSRVSSVYQSVHHFCLEILEYWMTVARGCVVIMEIP